MKTARILYHANCFDGCASAALLGRFLRAREPNPLVWRLLEELARERRAPTTPRPPATPPR